MGILKKMGVLEDLIEKAGGCAVVDGGLSTQLEKHGAQFNDALWSAVCLIQDPDLIKRVCLFQPPTQFVYRKICTDCTAFCLVRASSSFVRFGAFGLMFVLLSRYLLQALSFNKTCNFWYRYPANGIFTRLFIYLFGLLSNPSIQNEIIVSKWKCSYKNDQQGW